MPHQNRNIRRSRCYKKRKGSVLVISSLLIVMFCLLSAFAIDLGYMVVAESELQTTADASSLACATTLLELTKEGTGDPDTTAKSFAQLNNPDKGTMLEDDDLEYGVWDFTSKTFTATVFEPNAVRVTVRRGTANGNPLQLFFARMFLGASQSNLDSTSITAFEVTDEGGGDYSYSDPVLVQ